MALCVSDALAGAEQPSAAAQPSGEEVDEHADAEGDGGEHGEGEFDGSAEADRLDRLQLEFHAVFPSLSREYSAR